MYRETHISGISGSNVPRGPRAVQKDATIGPSCTSHEASPMRGLGNITSLCSSVTEDKARLPGLQADVSKAMCTVSVSGDWGRARPGR